MGWLRLARTEGFDVLQLCLQFRKVINQFVHNACHGSTQNLGRTLCAKVDDELTRLDWILQPQREFRHIVATHEIDDGHTPEPIIRTKSHFEVADFRSKEKHRDGEVR